MISDQAQLGYLALQNIVDAMRELAVEEKQEPVKEKKNGKKNQSKLIEQKVSKQIKKGVFQVFRKYVLIQLNRVRRSHQADCCQHPKWRTHPYFYL